MEDRCPGVFALSLDSIDGTIHSSFLSQGLFSEILVSILRIYNLAHISLPSH